MDNKIPKEIEVRLQTDEKLLWWGKPDKKIKSRYEIIGDWVFLLFVLLIIITALQNPLDKIINCLIAVLPLAAIYIFLKIRWHRRKKNTYFAITNQRAIELNNKSGGINFIVKPLSEIRYFETRYRKKGGDLNLGRYRFSIFLARFDYEKGYRDWFQNEILFDYKLRFKNRFDPQDYFCFFDLADVDTPAQIIRKRTNAKEYIDPKRKR